MRTLAILSVLSFIATPPFAQNALPNQQQPAGPKSGVGIAGQPGNKSGPAVKSPNSTTGSGADSDRRPNERNHDARQGSRVAWWQEWASRQVNVQSGIEIKSSSAYASTIECHLAPLRRGFLCAAEEAPAKGLTHRGLPASQTRRLIVSGARGDNASGAG